MSFFSSSAEVFGWLSRFINLEQGQKPSSFRPERMVIITEAAGNPQNCAPAIHVAGSKGKGSVTAMVSSVLNVAGLKPARFMSPHVTEYRERITADNEFFNESIYTAAGDELRAVTERLADASSGDYRRLQAVSGSGSPEPTFFELLTLYYFLCAQKAGCRSLAVETGLGGRLDPTNVVPSRVAVITSIELEHTEFLGQTLPEIAREKAGIIKKGKPLVLGEQTGESLKMFKAAAAERNSRFYYFPDCVRLTNTNVTKAGTDFTLEFNNSSLFPSPLDLSIPIPGLIQARNAALAAIALKLAFPAIGEAALREGLARLDIPARFERICADPVVIIDGAHTNNSALHCVATFTRLYGEGGILLFGCAAGKNAAAMAAAFVPHFAYVIITTPGLFKKSEPEKVFDLFRRSAGKGQPSSIEFIKETSSAVAFALNLAQKTGLPILGAGSFYLAAEIRSLVLRM